MRARERGKPILALESTIISHGMPFPENLSFAKRAESLCRNNGVEPATIAVIDGVPHVGLELEQLDKISRSDSIKKVSRGALGLSIARGWSGATTVSSTAHIANIAEIPVFSTGGIGGVHRDAELTFDISQDLIALSQTPIVVIASGAKSILDIPKTVELLETLSITTVGYNTKEFPSFYSRKLTASKCKACQPDLSAITANISSPRSVLSTIMADITAIKKPTKEPRR